MFHYFEALTNTKGDSLIGYFTRVIDRDTNGVITMAADENGTPIITTSGVADMCKTDAAGNLSFYVAPGTYHLDIYGTDATTFSKRVSDVAMTGVQGEQGEQGTPGINGGVGSSSGLGALFSTASGMTIGTGITRITTSGYSVAGVGGADYIYDAAVDAAYVTAWPRTAFLAADGRGFRLDRGQSLTVEMFGWIADCTTVTNYAGTYLASGFTSSLATPTGATDGAGIVYYISRYLKYVVGSSGTGGMAEVRFENCEPTKCYYSSTAIIPQASIRLKGNNGGGDSAATIGTIIRYPPNTPGVILNHFATQPGGYDTTGGGTGVVDTVIEGIWFQGGGGTTRTAHGLQQRIACVVKNCVFDSFAGDGTHNVGYVGLATSDPKFGQTSGTQYNRVTVRSAGNYASYVEGSDVSASIFIDLHHKSSRLGGLFDVGYFQNIYTGYQCNGHGYGATGACQHGGRKYQLIDYTTNIGSTTTPGTNNNVWEDLGALASPIATRFEAWSALNTYQVSSPAHIGGQVVMVAPYIEAYYLNMSSEPSGAGLVINNDTVSPKLAHMSVDAGETAIRSTKGWMQRNEYFPADPNSGAYDYVKTGGLYLQEFYRDADSLRWTLAYEGKDFRFGRQFPGGGYTATYYITGVGTSETCGRSASVPGVFSPDLFALSNGASGGRRIWVTGTAAPSTGNHAAGEIVWNSAPSAGGTPGWVCTTTGTPGTWKAMASLAA